MTPASPRPASWIIEFVALAAIWGASFLFMRIGTVAFGPVATAGLRVGIATVFLLPLLLARPAATSAPFTATVSACATGSRCASGTPSPTATVYHVALAPCGSADDGTGAMFITETWTGQITAFSASAGFTPSLK